jgi:hypothetical protein
MCQQVHICDFEYIAKRTIRKAYDEGTIDTRVIRVLMGESLRRHMSVVLDNLGSLRTVLYPQLVDETKKLMTLMYIAKYINTLRKIDVIDQYGTNFNST